MTTSVNTITPPAPLLKSPSLTKRIGSGSGNLLLGRKKKNDTQSIINTNSSLRSVSFGSSGPDGGEDDVVGPSSSNLADDAENDDPLLSLFRVHNTNRVKFDLQSDEDTNNKDSKQSSTNNNPPSPTRKASDKLKKFIPSFKRTPSNLTASCLLSKESNELDDNDPEDALIKKMLEPTPMRRISSFLDGMRSSSSSSGIRSSGSNSKLESRLAKEEEKAITLGELEGATQSFQQQQQTTVEGGSTISDISPTHTQNRANIPKSSKENIAKLLKKAQRSHKKSFRYRLAMKYYLLALKEMTAAGYSDTDPLTIKVLKSLNNVHHAQSTIQNSANIVGMGIQHEDKNQLIKSLRMYTIAYRMRRDSLGVDHPSLAVLLNMMGSVQVKRGEYGEAMKIYELSLKGRPDENGGKGRKKNEFRNNNPLTTSVTLRDMGMILEHKGNEDKALKFYHASLRYAVKFKTANTEQQQKLLSKRGDSDGGSDTGSLQGSATQGSSSGARGKSGGDVDDEKDWLDNMDNNIIDDSFSLKEVRMAKTTTIGKSESNATNGVDDVAENGEMELFLETRFDRWALSDHNKETSKGSDDDSKFYYDELFNQSDAQQPVGIAHFNSAKDKAKEGEAGAGAEMDIAMTLHQIGQIHRRSHRYAAALSAYNASLRGMKEVLGTQHGNIAAILGNIGNLYMETGDYDEAFTIYQEVLGIETLHLGLSHPEVAVTLHNIATIECSRGNFAEGVSLYKQVVDMQKIRYGNEHLTVAITLSCLADAYEKSRNISGAIKVYEEALKIRINVLGKSHLDVGRLMHKLGRLASTRKDYAIADIYMMRAMEIYSTNKLTQDHVFMREMNRDKADIQAGLAFAKK